jgi:hypothetical protein
METDQASNMHVNGHLLKEYITAARDGAERILPATYWSEMEAYHLANIYTTYQVAQLLWNPDADPDRLLDEIANAIWGPRDAPSVLEALRLIEEMRTGKTWMSYWHNSPSRTDGSDDPAADARRAADCLNKLAGLLQPDPTYVPKITLPVSRRDLLLVMLPHLEQIRRFAEFRLEMNRIKLAHEAGADKGAIRQRLAEAWKPVPDFDTWIGVYGQTESWRQEKLIRRFCKEAGIDPPLPPKWKISRDAFRALQKIENHQRVSPDVLLMDHEEIASEFSLDADYARMLMEKLEEEGWVERVEGTQYRLVNWKDIAYPARLRMGQAE